MLTCQRWMCKYVQSNNNFCTHDQLTRKANPAGTSSALFDRRLLGSGATLCLAVVLVGLGLSVWSGKGYPIAKYVSILNFFLGNERVDRQKIDGFFTKNRRMWWDLVSQIVFYCPLNNYIYFLSSKPKCEDIWGMCWCLHSMVGILLPSITTISIGKGIPNGRWSSAAENLSRDRNLGYVIKTYT